MSSLIVGDLHLKQKIVLPLVDHVIDANPEITRVVFLGDACDDWGAGEREEIAAMEFYASWVESRREQGLRVDVLLGNHDFCYLRARRGPGSVISIFRELRAILENDLRTQLSTCVGPYLCSHAGLTAAWARRYLADIPTSAQEASDALNAMLAEPECWPALDSCPPSRGGWSLPGPLWADLRDLVDDPLPYFGQIVGHTPVPTATMCPVVARSWKDDASSCIAACDTPAEPHGGAAACAGPAAGRDDVATCTGLAAERDDVAACANPASSHDVAARANPASSHGGAAARKSLGEARGSHRLWALDTMSLTSYGSPIGDGSMLLASDNDGGDIEMQVLPFPSKRGYDQIAWDYWQA